jgi:DNA-binding NarL/FixJ family response regulator
MDTTDLSAFLMVGSSNCLLRTAIAELLMKEALSKKVLQVDSPEEALKALDREQFLIAVVFVSHPITALLSRLVRLSDFKTKVLLVLNANDKFPMHYFSKYPIDGLISTDASYQEFKSAIRTVNLKNQKYVSPSLISSITGLFNEAPPFSHLSKKELDVALFILEGKRNSDIAAELNISQKTVSTYKARIYKKLEINNDAQLFRYAYNNDAEHEMH